MLKTLRLIFYYEMLLLWRRAHEWLYPLAFFMIVISMLPFAFSPDTTILRTLVPGGVWLAALFACMLSVESIFHAEKEEGTLQQWLLSSVPLPFILLTKITAQWLCTMLPLILLTPLIALLMQLSLHTAIILMLSLLAGTPILILLGTLGAALTTGFRQQGVMLSLLILPLASPVLIFGVNLVLQAEAGFNATAPLYLLTGICVLCLLGIPVAAAEAIKIGEDD